MSTKITLCAYLSFSEIVSDRMFSLKLKHNEIPTHTDINLVQLCLNGRKKRHFIKMKVNKLTD